MKRKTFHYLSFPKYQVLIESCLVVFIKLNVGAVHLFKEKIYIIKLKKFYLPSQNLEKCLMLSCTSVCPHVSSLVPTGPIFVEFYILDLG
jgi:hypothetical protein